MQECGGRKLVPPSCTASPHPSLPASFLPSLQASLEMLPRTIMEYSRFMGWGFEPSNFQMKGKGKPECWQNGQPWGGRHPGGLSAVMNPICSRPPLSKPFGNALSQGLWTSPYDLLWPMGQQQTMQAENENVFAHTLGPPLLLLLELWDNYVSEARLACWRRRDHMGQSLLSPLSSAGKPADGWMKPSKTTWPTSSSPTDLRHVNKPSRGQPCPAHISRPAQLTHWLMGSNEYSYFKPLNVGTVCYRAKAEWYTWEQL